MAKDFLNDGDGDLLIKDGDLVIDDSGAQHEMDMFLTGRGEIREFPTIGIGLFDWIDDDNLGDLPHIIQEQFEKDSATVNKLRVYDDGTIDRDIKYD